MSLFILCYRPRRPVLTVVSCFCLMSSICFLSVFMLSSLLSCVFHSVISCFVSPVCCCPHQVELIFLFRPRHVSVSVLSFHLSVLSLFSVVLLLSSCCPITTIIVPSCLLYHLVSFMSSVVVCVLSCLPSCYVLSRPLLSLSCLSSVRPPAVLWLCERDTSVRRILVHNKTHISIREQTNILVCRWSDGTRRGTISHPAGDKHNYSAAITECRDTERKTLLTSAARIHLDVWCLVELVSQCERQS